MFDHALLLGGMEARLTRSAEVTHCTSRNESLLRQVTRGKMVKRENVYRSLSVIGLVTLASPAQAYFWTERQVDSYFFDDRQCTLFTLSGVSQADAVTPNVPYFALPKTHPNYAELNALLLTAKVSQSVVSVETTGQLACGHAEVNKIVLW
jgi:hypothetical protein